MYICPGRLNPEVCAPLSLPPPGRHICTPKVVDWWEEGSISSCTSLDNTPNCKERNLQPATRHKQNGISPRKMGHLQVANQEPQNPAAARRRAAEDDKHSPVNHLATLQFAPPPRASWSHLGDTEGLVIRKDELERLAGLDLGAPKLHGHGCSVEACRKSQTHVKSRIERARFS